jgi:perosamine synthetase
MTEQIPFALPDLTAREIDAVVRVMRSGWLTSGAECGAFEEEFRDAVCAQHALAVNSCTAALHLSLEALGVGAGDVVFVPTYTFAATAETVRHVGAHPYFVDVDHDTANIDPEQLRRAIRESANVGAAKAVIPVHFSGVACEMEEIWAIAREHGLAVIEDAAHAFPATYQNRPIGWIPDDIRGTSCYSFYATKTITTGEGGMVTTNNVALAERMRVMSLHGLSRQAWSRYAGGTWRYDIASPGFKYNMTDMAAALGRVQLARANEMRDRRAAIAERYSDALADTTLFDLPTVPTNRSSAWHLYVLRLEGAAESQRDELIDALRADGIGVSMHFIPLHLHTYYRDTYGYAASDFPVSLDLYQRGLSLPIYSTMDDAQVDRVIEYGRKLLR